MRTDTLTGSTPGPRGYEQRVVTQAPAWHGLVAWDILFNGMTTGLFLVAAISELAAPQVFTPVAKIGYGVALIVLLVDLACLVLDLGDPLRFHHMLRVFKLGSPMSVGTWCLTAYSVPLAAAAAISALPGGWTHVEEVRRLAVMIGLLPALGSVVYKGVLLSTSAQPGWKDARWLGGYLTSAAVMLGNAQMLVLSSLMGHERAAAMLRPALALLLILNLIPFGLLVVDVRATLLGSYTRRQMYGVGVLSLGGGVLLPLGLLLGGSTSLFVVASAACIALASLAVRFAIIRLPYASP
jgi:Ni/Fe-hydrogenase subunit HybB-like protein